MCIDAGATTSSGLHYAGLAPGGMPPASLATGVEARRSEVAKPSAVRPTVEATELGECETVGDHNMCNWLTCVQPACDDYLSWFSVLSEHEAFRGVEDIVCVCVFGSE